MNLQRTAGLATKAFVALALVVAVMALLLFISAGTLRYWQAWVYLTIFVTASILTTRYLAKNDPALLARRMKGGPTAEKRPAQKIIMLFVSIAFIALLVVPALDHRFGWSRVPTAITLAANILVAAGFHVINRVYRENPFTAATIEIAKDQRVITTGPYAIVRHPMYAGALLYLGATPLALGSWWGLAAFAAMIPFLLWRLLDEERMLAVNLPGYREYQQNVQYRLVPYLW